MRIKCLTTFLDGAERFEKDDIRTVDEARAQRFLAHGWAVENIGGVPVEPFAGDVALQIQDGAIGLGDSNG